MTMNEWLIMLVKVKCVEIQMKWMDIAEEALEDGYVEKIHEDDTSYWGITEKGESYLRDAGLFEGNAYRSFHPMRCAALSKHYEEALPSSMNTWKTKDDLMVITKNHHVPDATYILPNGAIRGVKVVSKDMSLELIEEIEKNRPVLGVDEMLYLFPKNKC